MRGRAWNILKPGDVEIAYLDEGEGPTVLLGHCSAASHQGMGPADRQCWWRSGDVLALRISSATDSPGPWPAEKPFSIDADVEVIARGRGDGREAPLHLVGHSYGAALALEAARTLKDKVKSLTLIEPVSFHLLRLEDLPEWQDVEKLGVAVLDPVAKGDDKKAAGAFMSYWLGRWRWWIAPDSFKSAIAATIPKGGARVLNRPRCQEHGDGLCGDHRADFADHGIENAATNARGERALEQDASQCRSSEILKGRWPYESRSPIRPSSTS